MIMEKDYSAIMEALVNAAGSELVRGRSDFRAGPGVPNANRIATVQRLIRRFLEDVEGDMTVSELREALEEG
jgi:hypothetical protein